MPHVETYVDGIWHPSVSTIIHAEPKPWLDKWREKWGNLAVRKLEVANAIGTEFHRCVEQYLGTGTFTVTAPKTDAGREMPSCIPRVTGMMASFVNWAVNVDGDIHETELRVISRQHTYSGTLDAVGTFNGKPMLYDWKTSARIYSDMDLQLVAYAQAYEEQRGPKVAQGIIVLVSKEKPHFKLSFKIFKLGKRVFKKFLKLRSMFDEVHGTGNKEN